MLSPRCQTGTEDNQCETLCFICDAVPLKTVVLTRIYFTSRWSWVSIWDVFDPGSQRLMGKAQSSLLTVKPLLPLIGLSALYLFQPDPDLASLNCSTGSRSLYGHAAGTAVEGGFNSQRSRITMPIWLLLIYARWPWLTSRTGWPSSQSAYSS